MSTTSDPTGASDRDLDMVSGHAVLASDLTDGLDPVSIIEAVPASARKVCFVVYWKGLALGKGYKFYWRIFGPHGLCNDDGCDFVADTEDMMTSGWTERNPKTEPAGTWRLHVFLNGRQFIDKEFRIDDIPQVR